MTDSLTRKSQKEQKPNRRRGAVRTALVLFGIVFLIYLTFVGRAVFTYYSG